MLVLSLWATKEWENVLVYILIIWIQTVYIALCLVVTESVLCVFVLEAGGSETIAPQRRSGHFNSNALLFLQQREKIKGNLQVQHCLKPSLQTIMISLLFWKWQTIFNVFLQSNLKCNSLESERLGGSNVEGVAVRAPAQQAALKAKVQDECGGWMCWDATHTQN